MENFGGWIESSLSGARSVLSTSPSVGPVFLITMLCLWKFPRAQAFDPDPRPNIKNVTSSMMTPPPPQEAQPQLPGTPPPQASNLLEWETASSGSCDTQSVAAETSVYSDEAPKESLPQEPSCLMSHECPESTQAERHRFLVAQDGDEQKALENLHIYAEWRRQHEPLEKTQEEKHCSLQFDDYDLYDWIVASQTALHANTETKEVWLWLPRVIRTHTLPNGPTAADCDDSLILHMMPALIDDQICSLEAYSLAIVLYLNRKVQRDSLDKVTILMDLRPGEGWRNTPAVRLLPFIKSMVTLTLKMFPERLHKCVLYPLPWALSWVLNAVKTVMDPTTAKKLVVVEGGAGMNSPLPLQKLTKHVSKDVALMCEHERLESFSCYRRELDKLGMYSSVVSSHGSRI